MSLTFVEYWYAVEGKQKLLSSIDKSFEERFKFLNDVIRFCFARLINVIPFHKARIRKLDTFIEFPWDKEKKKKSMTPKEMKYALKAIVRYYKLREETKKELEKKRTTKENSNPRKLS